MCMPAVETGQMSSVETGQVSAVETGQVSAAETGQMSAAETRQMSTIATGRCPVLILYICLVSTHNVEVSETSTVPLFKSQKSQLWQCHNVQVSESRSGPKSPKITRNGFRIVARTRESTPGHAAAIFSSLGPVPRPKSAKI